MLINFTVSNFLSFDEKQTFSMEGGKARKHSKRLYKDSHVKLTKCKAVFGANASGKSNLTKAFEFVQDIILDKMPIGFTTKYFRLKPNNQELPSTFEVELLLSRKRIVYGFSVLLKTGIILEEYLYEKTSDCTNKNLYNRNTADSIFTVGDYFRKSSSKEKLLTYGEDSSSDAEILFLSIINHGKSKMYEDNPELKILQDIYRWFSRSLNISYPNSIITGYPYFSNSNLNEIAKLLNALGTGISDLRIVTVPQDVIKSRVPEDVYDKVLSDLERKKTKLPNKPITCMLRSYKEFYTFELNKNNELIIKTIEFSHEKESIYFSLNEESDGTARILDLIEILLKISDNKTLIIDEIDRCLHPVITTRIIELFLKIAEERNTQLIITSHESRLLATEILRNDEICFIVKNKDGASTLNPLECYQLRADKKIYAAMFDGTLPDVLPAYDSDKMENILKDDRAVLRL